jgi:hypothetical protein
MVQKKAKGLGAISKFACECNTTFEANNLLSSRV